MLKVIDEEVMIDSESFREEWKGLSRDTKFVLSGDKDHN